MCSCCASSEQKKWNKNMKNVPFSIYCCLAIRCRWKTFPKILNLCSDVRTIDERAWTRNCNQFLVSAKGNFRPFQWPKRSNRPQYLIIIFYVDDHVFERERESDRTETLWQSDQPVSNLCSDDVGNRSTKKLFVLSPYFVFVTAVHSIQSL